MLNQIRGESIVYRHANKASPGKDASGYPGLSETGVAQAISAGKGFLEEIINRPLGTVFVFSAHSSEPRTRSTLRALFRGVAEMLTENRLNNVLKIGDPSRMDHEELATHVLRISLDKVGLFSNQTVLVHAPRPQNGFDVSGWYKPDGSPIDYYTQLSELVGGDQNMFVQEWFANKGYLNGLRAPNPIKSANEVIRGIEELRAICTRRLPDRPIVPIGVGHSFNSDAYATALGNKGEVTREGYDNLGGRIIQEMEAVKVSRANPGNPESQLLLFYGDRPKRPIL